MAYDGRYDDPRVINAFLEEMRASSEIFPAAQEPNGVMINGDVSDQATNSSVNTPAVLDSPQNGLRAPPPTPETFATRCIEFEHLPSISEDQDEGADQVQMSANDPSPKMSPLAAAFYPSVMNTTSLSNEMAIDADNIDEANQAHVTSGHPDHGQYNSGIGTEPFPELQDELTAIAGDSDDDDSSVNIIVDAPKPAQSFKSVKSTVVTIAPDMTAIKTEDAVEADAIHTDTVPTPMHDVSMKEEPRMDATYFANWGNPAARHGPPARVRKVILSNLPPDADLTLVQSLIHGGAIELMQISSLTGASFTAYVTFTNADACDNFYDKYANGLEFKHKGKKCVAFVDKGPDVDVVSGIMQSYLDCGATRVIKAEGVDEEWSMRALHKVAEGPAGRRKVEAIIDNLRNNTRTVIFRFTNISDAVVCRGQLLRSPDWEDCNVQFMADPCEKASGVHFE